MERERRAAGLFGVCLSSYYADKLSFPLPSAASPTRPNSNSNSNLYGNSGSICCARPPWEATDFVRLSIRLFVRLFVQLFLRLSVLRRILDEPTSNLDSSAAVAISSRRSSGESWNGGASVLAARVAVAGPSAVRWYDLHGFHTPGSSRQGRYSGWMSLPELSSPLHVR
jgi:hypothetical protein